jgi:hypothetical protein
MENKIDIGKVFREKMDMLEKSPSDNLWANIEKDLETKRNIRFPFFWICSSILVTGLFLGSIYFHNASSNDQNQLRHNTNSSINQLTDTTEENGINTIKKNKNQSNSIENEGIQNKSIENINSNHISTQEKTNNSNSIVASDNNDSSQKICPKKSTKNSSLAHDSTSAKKSKHKQTTSKSKTTFSYETTRLVKNTRRLVKSTADYEEYEIVKQYTYIIKKKKKTHPSIKKNILSKQKKTQPLTQKSIPSKQKKTDSLKKKTPLKMPPKKRVLKDVVEIAQEEKPAIDTITTPLAEKEAKKIEKKERKKKKEKDSLISKKEKKYALYITPYFGPSYANSFNSTNPLSDKYNVNSKNGAISFNYGIYLRAMIAKKIGFRIGYGIINSKSSTTIFKQNDSFLDYRNTDYQITKTEAEINALFMNDSEVTFNQRISYSEIPLELYYIWKDNKFKFATSTGLGFLFLKNNELNLKSNSVSEFNIGKAKNLNKTSYTANLNLTLSYKISDKINIELSPNLKYQLKGFKRTNDYKPYIITLQTGLSYKY